MQRLILIFLLLGAAFVFGKAQPQRSIPSTVDIESFALELVTSPAERRNELLTAHARLINVDLRKELVRHGNVQFAGGKYTTAFEIYQLVERVAEQIDDKEGLATASLNIGSIYYFQGKYELALDKYRKAQSLFAMLGNRLDAARARFGLGLTYQAQQKPADALQSFEQALKEFEALDDKNEIATTLASIGSIQYELGNYEDATKAFLRVSGRNASGEDLVRIADAFYMQHEHAQALVYYKRALEIFESEAKPVGIISATAGVANSLYYQRNYDEALVYHKRGLGLEEELKDKSGIATRLQNIGNVYRAQGDYASALEYYSKSLAAAAEAPTKATVANTLGNIGVVRALQGDNPQAVEYFDKSLKEFETSGDEVGMARMLSLIGNARYLQGMYDLALEAYQRSRALHESRRDNLNQAHVLVGIGTVYLSRNEYGPALQRYEQALNIYEKLGRNADIAETLTSAASAYRLQGEYTRSLAAADKAVKLARTISAPSILSYALTETGRAQYSLKRQTEALNAFEEAIRIQQSLRADADPEELETKRSGIPPYLGAMETLIALGNFEKAFERAEDAKSQILFEVIHPGSFTISREMTPQERTEERRLRGEVVLLKLQESRLSDSDNKQVARIAKIRDRLSAGRAALQAFRRSLYTRHPQLKIDRAELAPFNLESARPFLNNNTALIEYAITDDRIFLFVITTTNENRKTRPSLLVNVYPLNVGRAELTSMAARFEEVVSSNNPSSQPARELYDLLIKPAEEQLSGKSALMIVPDGALWEVPFEALQTAEHQLIDRASISYAISLSALNEMRRRRTASRRVGPPTALFFGNPTLSECCVLERVRTLYKGMDQQEISRESPEINALQTSYGNARSRFNTGTDARKERVTTDVKSYNVLHFGTPAILDHHLPMHSFIILSPDPRSSGDGLLKLREVTELNSKAQVVVFSNSSVAQRHSPSGNAFIALSWAWFVAGTRAVILNRWQMEPTSVTDLVTELHRRLRQPRNLPAEALRQSALKVKHSPGRENPYHWSGFMALGGAL